MITSKLLTGEYDNVNNLVLIPPERLSSTGLLSLSGEKIMGAMIRDIYHSHDHSLEHRILLVFNSGYSVDISLAKEQQPGIVSVYTKEHTIDILKHVANTFRLYVGLEAKNCLRKLLK